MFRRDVRVISFQSAVPDSLRNSLFRAVRMKKAQAVTGIFDGM